MIAHDANLLEFLEKSPQFIIPIYQRTYSWTEQQCRQLWEDIIRAGSTDSVSAHFIGSVVYIEQGQSQVSNKSPLLVIDGQQRLTTTMLILEALSRYLSDREPVPGFSAEKLRNNYLVKSSERGERRFKLLLSQTDKDSLIALVTQKSLPDDGSVRIKENFGYFLELIKKLSGSYETLCRGLSKLIIVDIALSRDQDNPQLIFESMNSTGKALSQADLIRNFVLMGLKPEHQDELYLDYWRPMELEFGQEGYSDYFDRFMRHYLTAKSGDIPRIDEVYEAFKKYAQSNWMVSKGIEPLLSDVRDYARYFCAMALGKEKDKQLTEAFKDLRELKVDVAYPFLLELYHDYQQERLSKSELLEIVRLVEAYVFRRAVCSVPTNSLNKTFANFYKSLDKERHLESAKAHLISLRSYRRFPNDEEFKRELMIRDLYNFRSRSYWLRRLENFDRKERADVETYTIEHIMPQNENLSAKWREELGSDWKRVHETWLHTIGNLTLTAYNSEYRDHPFGIKRDMEKGFKQSPLILNEGLGLVPSWNEEEIKKRARKLANRAVGLWAAPQLPQDVLASYQESATESVGYTLKIHKHLAEGTKTRALFEQLRKEILALDPGISAEILKLYIAFKAETNFVDVVPQKSCLRLSLNMPFHELDDPKKLARDVTNLGRWGNGDVEVKLNNASELAYVMGLIRQSFEKQLGSDFD